MGTSSGRALMALAILVGIGGLLGPEIGQWVRKRAGGEAGERAKCPLGYSTESSASHPGVGAPLRGAPISRSTWFVNATIWTADDQLPWADCLAVDDGGALLAVGQGLQPPPGAEVHDMGGAFMQPAFIDPHIHLIPGGLLLRHANMRTASSKEEFISGAAAAARKLLPGQWLLGGLFDDNRWGGGLPDATWLDDEAAGGRPAWITRMDGHLGVANSAAMALAGVGADTPAPEGGVIDRDAHGHPTGVFREHAMSLITSHIPEPSPAERAAALAAAGQYLLSKGVTTVVDLGRAPFADLGATWRDLEEVLDPAATAGKLPVRVKAHVPLSQWARMAARVAATGPSHPSGRLFVGAVKGFHDGSLGSRTALMWEPYADDPTTHGTRAAALAALARDVGGADAAGLQVAVHAIGDRAVDEVLDLYAQAAEAARSAGDGGPADRPLHRIEHAQHLSGPGAAARAAALGVSVVANPLHLLTDRFMLLRRLGPERAVPGRAFAYRTLLDAGAHVSHASDWPVVDLDPVGSFYAAAYRREAGDGELPVPSEVLPPHEALLAHTARAAESAMLERLVGRLRRGMRADFVVLDASPFGLQGDSGEVLPRVLRTYMDGACVFGCAQ